MFPSYFNILGLRLRIVGCAELVKQFISSMYDLLPYKCATPAAAAALNVLMERLGWQK